MATLIFEWDPAKAVYTMRGDAIRIISARGAEPMSADDTTKKKLDGGIGVVSTR